MARDIRIEGLTPDDLLSLPDEELDALVLLDEPITFHAGSAEVLGQFRVVDRRLVVELAQIEGGGEGVLGTLWGLTSRYVDSRELDGVEWIVHALNCARPNPKLRRVLERRGFEVRDLPKIGEAYYLLVDRNEVE